MTLNLNEARTKAIILDQIRPLMSHLLIRVPCLCLIKLLSAAIFNWILLFCCLFYVLLLIPLYFMVFQNCAIEIKWFGLFLSVEFTIATSTNYMSHNFKLFYLTEQGDSENPILACFFVWWMWSLNLGHQENRFSLEKRGLWEGFFIHLQEKQLFIDFNWSYQVIRFLSHISTFSCGMFKGVLWALLSHQLHLNWD